MTASTGARGARVESWDLFCRVVDNYGDIGIAWRLARQLAQGAHRAVRLRVDDLHAFGRIEPRVAPAARRQTIADIEVLHWLTDGRDVVEPADVVVELFGCGLPDDYLEAMADTGRPTQRPRAVWVDLEYLSAEAWVDGFHRLPSPHPTLPLVKHFFYPGFGPHAGGLLIEPGLDESRRAFLEDRDRVEAFWRRLRVPVPLATEMRISLFAYANDALLPLLDAIASDRDKPWSVLVPEGVLTREIEAFLTARHAQQGRVDALSVYTIPFVDQDAYDRVLWSCDINFVRGEDSFVRAQCAARPFVWHIYPQADDVHIAKLNAFEDRYEAGLQPAARAAQRQLWKAWNGEYASLGPAWAAWLRYLPELSAHAEVWRQSLVAEPGLVDRLAKFVAGQRGVLLK